MSGRLFVVESGPKGLRAAMVADSRLQAVEIDRADRPSLVGAVVQAKVVRTLPGLGTIIALADRTELLLEREKTPPVSGAMVTAQVTKAARGEKLATATRAIALTGRALVHLPLENTIRFSRRLILDETGRAAIAAQLAGTKGGWIVRRTAGLADPADLVAEIANLPSGSAPNAFARLAGDYSLPPPDRILAEGLAAKRTAERWCAAFALSLLSRIDSEAALFDRYDLDSAIESLADMRVNLPGGGSLIIQPTEALTVIDVNSGSDSSILSVNLEAVSEIGRQLRLRHIGGIVVIDFISMAKPRDRDRVMAALDAALADDPAQTHILPMSAFGLVEMTRERRGPALELGN